MKNKNRISLTIILVFSFGGSVARQEKTNAQPQPVHTRIMDIETRWYYGNYTNENNRTTTWDMWVITGFTLAVANLDSENHEINGVNVSKANFISHNQWEFAGYDTAELEVPIILKPQEYCNFTFNADSGRYSNIFVNVDGEWYKFTMGSSNELCEEWSNVKYHKRSSATFFISIFIVLLSLILVKDLKRKNDSYNPRKKK